MSKHCVHRRRPQCGKPPLTLPSPIRPSSTHCIPIPRPPSYCPARGRQYCGWNWQDPSIRIKKVSFPCCVFHSKIAAPAPHSPVILLLPSNLLAHWRLTPISPPQTVHGPRLPWAQPPLPLPKGKVSFPCCVFCPKILPLHFTHPLSSSCLPIAKGTGTYCGFRRHSIDQANHQAMRSLAADGGCIR